MAHTTSVFREIGRPLSATGKLSRNVLVSTFHRGAFTLVELLVVIGIVSLLVALTMSVVVNARRQANEVVCAVNVGNMAKSLIAYAQDYNGAFPPNLTFVHFNWFDEIVIGQHASYRYFGGLDAHGPSLTCPSDNGAIRSYSMNMWASSAVMSNMQDLSPTYGTFWKYNAQPSAQLLLAVETFSVGSFGFEGSNVTHAFAGQRGFPVGQRFGALGGVTPFKIVDGRYVNSQLEWRHGTRDNPRINLAFADGHVKSFIRSDLVYPDGTLTGEAYWSPTDRP